MSSETIDEQLLERMVRIEEELKSQRELMEIKFDAVDRRFEAVDARFEAQDARFVSINARFEAVDKRFESMDARFVSMDARFEDLIHHSDRRFDDMHSSFRRTQWLMGLGFVLVTAVVSVFGMLA